MVFIVSGRSEERVKSINESRAYLPILQTSDLIVRPFRPIAAACEEVCRALGLAGRADRMSEALGAKDIEVADSGARGANIVGSERRKARR